MKFLIMVRNRGYEGVPPAAWAAFIEATKAFITRGRNAGKWEAIYAYPKGGVANATHETAEELYSWLSEYPFYGFVDIEVLPLSDVDKALDKALETARQSAAMVGAGH